MHHLSNKDNKDRHLPIAIVALLGAFVLPALAWAKQIADIEVPDTAQVAGQTLTLNGAGLRSKFFVRIYVGALYLQQAGMTETGQVMRASGPKRVSMHMIYDELTKEKITAAWSDGFRANTAQDELLALSSSIDAFNALWPTLKSADVAHVDLLGQDSVRVSVNGIVLGTVQGPGLPQAVLRIWLGDDPADSDLKRGMLNGS